MFTRAQVIVPYPRDLVFDVLLYACKEAKAKVKNSDKTSHQIDGKSPTTFSRFGQTIRILLEVPDGTNIRIFENGFYGEDQRFINSLLKALSKRIPFNSQLNVDSVKDLESGIDVVSSDPNPMLKSTSSISSACSRCNSDSIRFHFHNPLCSKCFEEEFGSVVKEGMAEYHGGHKAHIAGGVFTKYEYGGLYATNNYLIFSRPDKDMTKRWDIRIRLASVAIDKWHIEEESRRKQFIAGGSSIDNIGIGGGIIEESGKAHHLVIPYVDENSIPQEPRFGISSIGGKAIREWAGEIYSRIGEAKRQEQVEVEVTKKSVENMEINTSKTAQEDPIHVLKIRYAKGEISKEQFDEMRKNLE